MSISKNQRSQIIRWTVIFILEQDLILKKALTYSKIFLHTS